MFEREQLRAALELRPHAARYERGAASAAGAPARLGRRRRRRARPDRALRRARPICSSACAPTATWTRSPRQLRALGATTEAFDVTGVIAATVPSRRRRRAARCAHDPRVAYVEPRPEARRSRPTSSTGSTRAPGIKFTWAYDAVRAGEAIAAVGGGSSRLVAVVDTGLDVNHPEFAGPDQAHGRHGVRRART